MNLHYSQKLESKASLDLFINRILPREIDRVWRRKSKQIIKCKNGSMREGAAICLTAGYRWPLELGLNPAKLDKIDNHWQEPWKLPLPRFIEQLYFERFGKTTPDHVASVEEQRRRYAALLSEVLTVQRQAAVT